MQCAKCHNHPFNRWTQNDYHQLAAFFARVQYKILENKRRDKLDSHEFIGEQVVYLADKGFQGRHTHARWRRQYGAQVIAAPQANQVPAKHPWPQGLRRALASMRQIAETAVEKLGHAFALLEERPHTLAGFGARLAARVALHNLCLWINRRLGRPSLAFAELVLW